jgi:hypothetical protein
MFWQWAGYSGIIMIGKISGVAEFDLKEISVYRGLMIFDLEETAFFK